MIRLLPRLAALVAVLAAVPAPAAERRYSLTDFDRIRVEGPYRVTVRQGANAAAASGSPAAIERVAIDVQGRTLRIRPNRSGWGGYPGEASGPVSVAIAARQLLGVSVEGNGRIDVDAMTGMRVEAGVAGGGTLAIARIEADQAVIGLAGTGSVTVAGKAATTRLTAAGSGDLDAGGLAAADLRIDTSTAGTVTARASRAATIMATGSGDVIVSGRPACTVRGAGAGRIDCGGRDPR